MAYLHIRSSRDPTGHTDRAYGQRHGHGLINEASLASLLMLQAF